MTVTRPSFWATATGISRPWQARDGINICHLRWLDEHDTCQISRDVHDVQAGPSSNRCPISRHLPRCPTQIAPICGRQADLLRQRGLSTTSYLLSALSLTSLPNISTETEWPESRWCGRPAETASHGRLTRTAIRAGHGTGPDSCSFENRALAVDCCKVSGLPYCQDVPARPMTCRTRVEPCHAVLITQRSRVQIPPPLPGKCRSEA